MMVVVHAFTRGSRTKNSASRKLPTDKGCAQRLSKIMSMMFDDTAIDEDKRVHSDRDGINTGDARRLVIEHSNDLS